jgi:uncharacterized membrane protein (UPF0127 family)
MTVGAEAQQSTWGHIDINAAIQPFVAQARNILPFLLIFLLVGGTIVFAISCKGSTVAFSNDSKVATLNIEVADTAAEQARGLMGRTELGKDSGMLFDFKGDTSTAFYMKDTSIPLSIAFIESSGKVVAVKDMKPLDLTPVESPSTYRYAIETNQGWFAQHGIAPGYRATIDI